jgi:hypothetical protein
VSREITSGKIRTDLCVHLERKHDLRSTIPSRRHVFGHQTHLLSSRHARLHAPCQAKIANFEIAVGVEQEVGGLKIAVDDVGAVDRLESAKRLVDKVLSDITSKAGNTEEGAMRELT